MEQRSNQSSLRNKLSKLGWLGLFLGMIGGKLKTLLPLLKFGKFGGTIISMFISIGGYALLYPWQFAVGLVIMIFIHEMGHVWAAKRKGLPVSAPSFIPFLGALITMKRQPSDAATEAYLAYGGPLIGTLGAFACYGLALWTGQEILFTIALTGFLINLFNLIPIHPLDGGRIVTAITRWLWVAGLIIGLAAIIYLRSILLALIYLMFVWELWSTYGKRNKKSEKLRTFQLKAKVDPLLFEEKSICIPGEEHRRPLPFTQYCKIDTQEHLVSIEFPGVGVIATLNVLAGITHKVHLVRTTHSNNSINPMKMTFEFEFQGNDSNTGGLQKDEKYYAVPTKLRWAYGFAYVSLITVLLYMIAVVNKALNVSA